MRFRIFSSYPYSASYVYDNLTNEIIDEFTDEPVDFGEAKDIVLPLNCNKVEPFDISNKVYPYPKKDKLIRVLKIQIGTNCNYKCAYCVHTARGNDFSVVPSKDDLIKFFDMLDKSGVQLAKNAKIQIWGGEPLVYWKALQPLIVMLRHKFPNTPIWTISNGSLLTNEIIDFFIDKRVDLTLSHDGPAQYLRGKDPLLDLSTLGLWQKAKQEMTRAGLEFKFNIVLSRYNVDLFLLDKYFVSRFGEDVKYRYEDVIMVHSSNAVRLVEFSRHEQRDLNNSVKAAIFGKTADCKRIVNAMNGWPLEFLTRLIYRIPADAIKARCNAMDSDVLSVALDGSVISCHNVSLSDQTMGSLLDYDNVKVNKFTHWSLRENCPKCMYLSICKGNCSRNNSFLHAAGCPSKKALAEAIFRACWTILTNSEISTIHLER